MKYLILMLLASCILDSSNGQNWESLNSNKIPIEKVLRSRGVIWGFDFFNSNEILFTKRSGELFHYNIQTKEFTKQDAPKVEASGQGGLLDVLIHENFVYLTYSKPLAENNIVTALAQGKWESGKLTGLKDIFISNAGGDKGQHFGSRLAIREDELFMSVGERGERDLSQSLKHHNGKILRLKMDGRAYPGNPFAKDGLAEIFSYGHRNPQGIAVHPVSKEIYSCEFGPRGGDEINLVKAGNNYGWPVITYGSEYYGPKIGVEKKAGMEQPLVHYTPSISPSGMTIYSGKLNEKLKNNFFLAALGNNYVHRVVFEDGHKVKLQQKWLEDLGERIRQIKEGPDGHLYFSTDSGNFYRLRIDKVQL